MQSDENCWCEAASLSRAIPQTRMDWLNVRIMVGVARASDLVPVVVYFSDASGPTTIVWFQMLALKSFTSTRNFCSHWLFSLDNMVIRETVVRSFLEFFTRFYVPTAWAHQMGYSRPSCVLGSSWKFFTQPKVTKIVSRRVDINTLVHLWILLRLPDSWCHHETSSDVLKGRWSSPGPSTSAHLTLGFHVDPFSLSSWVFGPSWELLTGLQATTIVSRNIYTHRF